MNVKSLTILAILLTGLIFNSCDNNKKSNKKNSPNTEKHHDHDHEKADLDNTEKSEETAMAKYHCPMRCEGDKTYKKPGNCPDCKMDLKIVEDHKHNGHNEADHNHDAH